MNLRQGWMGVLAAVLAAAIVSAGCTDDGKAATDLDVSVDADPAAGPAPLEVSFEVGLDSGVDRDQVTYSWDFGDGDSSTKAAPSHTYEDEGQYRVTVTVTQPDGTTEAASRTVDVGSPDGDDGEQPTTSADEGEPEVAQDEPDPGFDDWVDGVNAACERSEMEAEEAQQTATGPDDPQYLEATVTITLTETETIDGLGVPEERGSEVQTWKDTRQQAADFFVESAGDGEISLDEGTQLQQLSLQIDPLSAELGLTSCTSQ